MSVEDFPAVREAFELKHVNDFDSFRNALSERVLEWLLHDNEKLRRVLYRIDVSEKLARNAFDGIDAPIVAQRLTDLLIERELKKIATRKSSAGNDWLDV